MRTLFARRMGDQNPVSDLEIDEIEVEYLTAECPVCGGGGFSGPGTMYDDVCDECGGQGEVIIGIKDK